MTLPNPLNETRVRVLLASAERDRIAAARCYETSTILSRNAKHARRIFYLLWTTVLLILAVNGIFPAWLIVAIAAVGYPALAEVAKSPAKALYEEGSKLDERAAETEKAAHVIESSGSTSGNTGGSLN